MAAEKCALLVIDMQNDFCLPGAPLFVAGAPGVTEAVKDAVLVARAKAVPVIWVVREHHVSGVDAEVTRAHLYKDGKGPVALLTPGALGVRGVFLFCPFVALSPPTPTPTPLPLLITD
jgi:nicotinamidase-related amidase